MYKILIIEDDEKLRNELKIFLENNGYISEYITDFSINNILHNFNYDLILLDLNLPNIDGYYICKEIRKNYSIPIIIITSKNTDIDELTSINIGADDFITKPFNTQILLARINTILKRVNNVDNNLIIFNNIKLDLLKSYITNNEKSIELTKNELKILHCMFKNKDKIVTREELMEYLWDSEMFVDDNTLTVNINRLRKKLEEIDVFNLIETRRGHGYILNEV
ncbi:MAG: response regulator transcription factor [Clostridia bacterium]